LTRFFWALIHLLCAFSVSVTVHHWLSLALLFRSIFRWFLPGLAVDPWVLAVLTAANIQRAQ
jgi:hypothetical protein